MYKITNDKTNPGRYVVECYFYDVNSHSNKSLYTASNLKQDSVVYIVQGREVRDTDVDMVFDVLRLTRCPAIIKDTGELTSVPVV